MGSLPEVMPVAEARESLSRVLNGFRERGRDAAPVFIGSRRKAEAVIMPVQLFEELAPFIEDLLLAREVRRREAGDTGQRVTHEELLGSLGYTPDHFE